MLITDILTVKRVKVPLESTTKEALITEMVDLLCANGGLQDRQRVLDAVLEREHTRTTGIGNGIAIPHGKTAAVTDLVMAIGRTAQPIEYDSVDQRPVSLVIMLVSPMDQTGPHIQALAHVSRLLSNDAFRNKLNHAQSAGELFKLIKQQEEAKE